MKRSLLFSMLITLCFLANAQETITVTGTVTDASGETLPGAIVIVPGSPDGIVKASTMADIDGKYSISCAVGETLVFQYLGMRDEKITFNGKIPCDVVMKADVSTTLNESVVIGYGSVRREDLTGSVSNVKMGDIKDSPVSSVDQALQGRVAGADVMSTSGEPGSTTSIRIRGTRSISASNEPLIVVDGVMDAVSDLNDINPADIEDISILKDASSTAIYGARGANGVILVTTKASSTQGSSRPKITFKADAGISMLPSNLDLMNSEEYAIYRMDIDDWRNNRYSKPIADKVSVDPMTRGQGTDWIKEVTRITPYQNYYVSLSGGTNKTNYWASAGYNDNQGIIKKSGDRKISTTISVSHQLFEHLRIGYKSSFTYRHTDNPLTKIGGTGWYNSAQYLSPTIKPDDVYNPYYYEGSMINTPTNVIKYTTNYYDRYSTVQNLWTEATIAKYLKWKLSYNLFYYDRQLYGYTSSQLPAKVEGAGGDGKRETYKEMRHTFETTLSFKKDWKKRHYVDAVVGFTGVKFNSELFSLSGSGYMVDEMLWNDMGAVMDKNTYAASTNGKMKNNLSVIARANYNFNQRYYITVTGRVDGASNFAQNHKWGFFPSAALKWNIHNEKFMKGASQVDELSLKASVGQTGNDSIGYFYSNAALVSATGPLLNDSRPAIFRPVRIESPNLTWETTTMYNVGLTGKFFNSRLNITAEAYMSHTDNLLLSVKVPFSTGYGTRYANLGRTTNDGLELTIDSRNIVRKNFTWSTTFTIAHNRQMVKDIGEEAYVSTYNSPGNNPYMMMGYKAGYPLNSLWGFTYAGVWHNQEEVARNARTHTYVSQTTNQELGTPRYVDVNHDGNLNQDDLCYLGNADPVIYGGLQNSFRIGNFKLNMYWTYSLGGKIYNYSMFWTAGGMYTNQYRMMINAWHPIKNPQSDIPRAGYYELAVPSNFMVFDASFLRLQDLSLSYTLPCKKSVLKDVMFTLSGNNLFLLKKYNGFDPDVSSEGTSSTVRRMDVGAYPKARRVVFSIQIRY